MLLGVRDSGGGLGNNADEIKTATLLFDNIVIKPYQDELCYAIDTIIAVNNISLNLYFKTIQPLEFTDLENTQTQEQVTEETGLSSHTCLSSEFTDEEGDVLLESLNGETIDEEWELVDKREYSDKNISIEEWANSKIKAKDNLFQQLADFIKSKPSDKSSLDKGIYKVRYEYSEKYSSGISREFCRRMMSRTTNGVVYRKEDIDQASFQGVNNSFGHNGENYSLFKYKGGVNCGHVWNENLYRLKTKTDGTPYVDKSLSSSEEVDSIAGYNPNPSGWAEAQIAPIDMPNRGHHPNYKG
jgi:spore germination protein YaaH